VEVEDKEDKTPLGDVVKEPYRSEEDHGVAEDTVMVLLLDYSKQDGTDCGYR
jgi:hypothetical protein